MKLDPVQGELRMGQAHDETVVSAGGNRQGRRVDLHHQGMIAGRRERARQPLEQRPAFMMDGTHLAVPGKGRAHGPSLEDLIDALHAKTDAQDRKAAMPFADDRYGNAGMGGILRPRADQQIVRLQRRDLVQGEFVAPENQEVQILLQEHLDQIVGK